MPLGDNWGSPKEGTLIRSTMVMARLVSELAIETIEISMKHVILLISFNIDTHFSFTRTVCKM